MADVQVTCINKQPRNNTHEGITHLGGAGWKWPRSQVILSIEQRSNTFFTMVGGRRADVGVVDGPNGKYVRTYADGYYQRQSSGVAGMPIGTADRGETA
ncbi:DUF3892 domain-containing protein [Bradyrhizobium sp. SUTN9-2]|uniref:DUF3892 domain-containing protein n=1 Tax=Bradyrhizobium sp. SUTN9-2 TaxID=1167456 RepID=UPI001FCE3AE1|nr:DUF3892 domain-containing protein [Bradyrhizobium sp. SUTN9-2]